MVSGAFGGAEASATSRWKALRQALADGGEDDDRIAELVTEYCVVLEHQTDPGIKWRPMNHVSTARVASAPDDEGHWKDVVQRELMDLLRFLEGVRVREPVVDPDGKIPSLIAACVFGDLEVIKLLCSFEKRLVAEVYYTAAMISPLHVACGCGHAGVVEWLVEQQAASVEIDGCDDQGVTPLMVAAATGRLRIVQYLVSMGADAARGNAFGKNVVYQCAANGNVDLLRYFFEHGIGEYDASGARVNLLDGASSREENLDVLQYLLEHGKYEQQHVAACFHSAIERNDVELVQLLLSYGADVHGDDGNTGHTPLYHALRVGGLEILEILLDHGADITRPVAPNESCTAVQEMARLGRVEMIKLVERRFGGDTDFFAEYGGVTALCAAAACGHSETLEFLLRVLPDSSIDSADGDLDTPLMIAATNGHTEAVETLILHGAEVDKVVHDSTALIRAAESGKLAVVRSLCDHGADVDLEPLGCSPAFVVAARMGHADIVEYLFEERRCAVNLGAESSILSAAAIRGQTDMVRVLLSFGAQVANQEECSDLLCKVIRGWHCEAVKVLVQHGANVNAPFTFSIQTSRVGGAVLSFTVTPLTVAAGCGNLEIVKYLCESGADVEGRTDAGESALFLAAQKRSLEIVEYLVTEQCADVESVDIHAFSPVQVAKCNGREDIVHFLLGCGAKQCERVIQNRDAYGSLLLMRQLAPALAIVDGNAQDELAYWERKRDLDAFLLGNFT